MTYHDDRVIGGDSMRRQIENGALITTQTAARLAGVEPVTIWVMVNRGRLRPVLRRPKALFRRRDVETLAATEHPAMTEAEVRDLILAGEVATSEQVAQYLGVSRITVRTLATKGELQPLQPGVKPLVFLWDQVHDLGYERRQKGRRALVGRQTRGESHA